MHGVEPAQPTREKHIDEGSCSIALLICGPFVENSLLCKGVSLHCLRVCDYHDSRKWLVLNHSKLLTFYPVETKLELSQNTIHFIKHRPQWAFRALMEMFHTI